MYYLILPIQQPYVVTTIIIFTLELLKMKLAVFKGLAPDHIASKPWKASDSRIPVLYGAPPSYWACVTLSLL